MRVLRSQGEPDLIHVLLTDAESAELRRDLRKRKSPLARDLRRRLKKAINGR